MLLGLVLAVEELAVQLRRLLADLLKGDQALLRGPQGLLQERRVARAEDGPRRRRRRRHGRDLVAEAVGR